MKKFRTVILPIVGGLVIGGWLFLKWDAYRVKWVQLHILLEQTGLKLESINESYQIVEYEYQEGWGDFDYRFKIRFAGSQSKKAFFPNAAPAGKWMWQNGQYEFYCTRPECYSDWVFGRFNPRTRELTLHLIHI